MAESSHVAGRGRRAGKAARAPSRAAAHDGSRDGSFVTSRGGIALERARGIPLGERERERAHARRRGHVVEHERLARAPCDGLGGDVHLADVDTGPATDTTPSDVLAD